MIASLLNEVVIPFYFIVSKNFKFIISIFVVIPLFIWLVTFQAMPRLSYNIAKEVSDESKALISENLI